MRIYIICIFYYTISITINGEEMETGLKNSTLNRVRDSSFPPNTKEMRTGT